MREFLSDVGRGVSRAIRRTGQNAGANGLIALTLAVSVGPLVAAFAFTRTPSLADAGIGQPESLHAITSRSADPRVLSDGAPYLSYAEFLDLNRRTRVFENMAAFARTSVAMSTFAAPDSTIAVQSELVSGNYFATLHASTRRGRLLSPDDDAQARPFVVISDDLRRSAFGADESVVGRSVFVGRHSFLVVGVAPPNFHGVHPRARVDAWFPASIGPELPDGGPSLTSRGDRFFSVVGRVAPTIRVEAVGADLKDITRQLAAEGTDPVGPREYTSALLQAPARLNAADDLELSGWLLAACVLAVGACNIVGILLARHARRERDEAVRMALGSTFGFIVRENVLESTLVALVGTAGGLLVSVWVLGLIRSLATDVVIAPMSVSMVGFAMSIVFLATFAFAIAPAWTLRRADLGTALRNGRNDGNRRTRGWRHMLVILQVAAAVIVSISAAALTRGVQHLRRFDPGYQTAGLLAVHVNSVTGTAGRREVFVNELRSALRNVPGVTNAGFGLWPLLGFDTDRPGSQRRIRIVGRNTDQRVAHDIVDAGYFSTLGVHIIAGHDFDPRDAVNASRQVVINEAMAKSLWPAESPVGSQVLLLPDDGQPPKQAEVIGVVGDFMTDAAGIGRIAPRIFVGYDRWTPVMFSTLYIRMDRESSARVAAIRRAIMAVSGSSAKQPDISTMDQARERAIAPYRLALFGVALLAGIALLLAVGGLYGLVSYLVTGRTREFGIRIALGAHGTDIVRLVIVDALIPVAIGAFLGLGGAVVAMRAMPLLSELMFRSGPLDPYVLGVTTIGLIVIALTASVVPARRAFNIQPTEALRAE